MLSALAQVDKEIGDSFIFLNKMLDPIMALPFGPERWLAVHKLLKQANPIAGENDKGNPVKFNTVDRKCIKDNKIFKEGLINKFGGSETKTKGLTSGNNFRASLSMPRLLHNTIELVDPMAFRLAANRNLMFKTFPQYTRSEVTNASKD